jgi:hypothetical protein
LLALALLLGITHAIMWPFGRRVRWCASLGFGVLYLTMGEWMTLQREYLLLLPIGSAVAIVGSPRITSLWKAALAGLLVGVAGTIKPQAALALPFVVGYVWLEARRNQPLRRSWLLIAGALTTFAVPFALVAYYLWRSGGLAGFADVTVNYWPLYEALSGTRPHRVLVGAARYAYVFDHTLIFGVHPGLPLLGAAVVGVRWALRSELPPGRQARCLASREPRGLLYSVCRGCREVLDLSLASLRLFRDAPHRPGIRRRSGSGSS